MPAVAPVWSWSGFYVGGHAGYGWGRPDIVDAVTNVTAGNKPQLSGFLGGVQAGYLWQRDRWVYGLEGDFTWADVSATSNLSIPSGIINTKILAQEFATFTARVGWADGRFLYYVKGGGAMVYEKYTQLSVTTPICTGRACTGNDDNWGWTASAGVEYAIDPRWSVRAEYSYLDFGRGEKVRISNGASFSNFNITNRFDLFKVGVNCKIGG